jgi:hypothetical protein
MFFSEEKNQKTFILCANLTVRFRSEVCFQVVNLISTGEQLRLFASFCSEKEGASLFS